MKRKPILYIASICFGLLISLQACTSKTAGDNELSRKEQQDGFRLLFDGKTLDGWHIYNQGKISSTWNVKNGELQCIAESDATHGDLVTDEIFENYELIFDWKISKEGNSGVFVNVLERADIPTAWTSGPEYQLLEESHHDQANTLKRAGCLYNFTPQLNTVKLNPLGEWNHSIIRQKNGNIEFELNGVITAKTDFKSENWKNSIKNTGFVNFPEFGKYTKGQIALQDWNKGVSFKNIKIRSI